MVRLDELTFVWNSMLCALAVMTLMSAYRRHSVSWRENVQMWVGETVSSVGPELCEVYF